jgi:nucleoside-diphosphate-sugar epimerase
MNILVTGATGFVGRNLIKKLRQHHTIHILVRPNSNRTDLCVNHVFEFSDNIEELADYLSDNKIDGIIHLASLYLAQHKSEQIKELVLSNIYLGTALLESSKLAKTRWFLNTGTIWQNYISDSVEYCPVNLYAASKQAFMDMAKYYTETSGLRFCTLKLCDTYGPGDTRRKIFTLFKEIAESGEMLDMSPGEQKLDILYIDDVINGFEILAEQLQSGAPLEREYVLSSGKQYSLKELAHIFETSSGKKLNINWGKRSYREREVMQPWQRGKLLPGWKVRISLHDGLKFIK